MELGIVKKDGIYFPRISDFARNNLYYVQWCATYLCNGLYEVKRDSIDSCILFNILKGELHFNYRDETFSAKKGQVVILSGQYANHYYATSDVYFDWFHFSGSSTENYVEYLYNVRGPVFSLENSKLAQPFVRDIMDSIRNENNNDHAISYYIQGIFSHLSNDQFHYERNSVINDACNYLNQHYNESIHVDELSQHFNLSRFHFSRLFKKETGTTPHQYLLHIRLTEAKKLLSNTTYSVEEIAIYCGFNSTSHFIRAFKNVVNITPHQFRQLKL